MLIEYRQQISPTEKDHDPLKGPVDSIIFHRIGIGVNASDVLNAFTGGIPEAAKATGYKMPYHFLIERDGAVVQCLSLSKMGYHALSWNPRSVGVAALGDFRRREPSVAQWTSARLLCGLLAYPQGWRILGHTEAPGGSSNPYKQCPGARWDMNKFREEITGLGITEGDVNDFWRYLRY